MLDAAHPDDLGGQSAVEGLRSDPGEHGHGACPVRVVAGAAQSLHGAGDGAWSADLKNLIDLAHVDAQFHGRGGNQQSQGAAPERCFHLKALLLRQAAVVGAGKIRSAQLVDEVRELFGIGPALDEGDDAARALAMLINGSRQRLPNGVLFGRVRLSEGACDLKPHILAHFRCGQCHGVGG